MNSATVKVKLVVEVQSHGSWGQDCTIAQAKDQGLEAAMANLQRALGTASGIKVIRAEAVDIVVHCEAGK